MRESTIIRCRPRGGRALALALVPAVLIGAPFAPAGRGGMADGPMTVTSATRPSRSVAAGEQLYVSPFGSDSNSCASPVRPCRTVGSAIGKARAGDRIAVAAGTYPGGMAITKALDIAGAGAGRTIFDAGGLGRVVSVNGVTVRLSGLTLRRGRVGDDQNGGGGLFAEHGDVTLSDVTVEGNTAAASNGNQGGGIYVRFSRLTLSHATVSGNTSTNGGGGVMGTDDSTLTIDGGAIAGNNSPYAGGLLVANSSTATLSGSTVSRNKTTDSTGAGGGIDADGTGVRIAVDGGSIAGNSAGNNGGAGVSATNDARVSLRGTTVSGNTTKGSGGGLALDNGAAITITNSIVRDNRAAEGGAGISVSSNGHLALVGAIVAGNTARYGGGGIAVDTADVTLRRAAVRGNTATEPDAGAGGGIYATGGAILSMVGSNVQGNTGHYYGGGLYIGKGVQATLDRSLVAGNMNIATYGGGGMALQQSAAVTLTNSTVSDNATRPPTGQTSDAAAGGGIEVDLAHSSGDSRLMVVASTIAGNRAFYAGGGIYYDARDNSPGHAPAIRASILAGNRAGMGPDCYGALASGGYDLVGEGSGCALGGGAGNKVGVDAGLGPLADNGGPTRTRALLAGSPAIGALTAAACAGLATDQRGYARPRGSACDIGAFEADATRASAP